MAAVLVAGMVVMSGARWPASAGQRASALTGYTNGRLPGTVLGPAGPGCTLYRPAADDLRRLLNAAAQAGVPLRATSCYRDQAGQVAARQRWCALGACRMAAVPGTSTHGWGKAVDLASTRGTITFGDPAWQWLTRWAGRYNFRHPDSMGPGSATPEAWHWEWVGDGGTG